MHTVRIGSGMGKGITVHMVVKNEDQWVWYAVTSVLPFADRILITDTGSTDRTREIVKSIKSDKIVFREELAESRSDVTAVRDRQIGMTKTPWIWVVDGDEIYTRGGAKEIVKAAESGKYRVIVVRRYDLLGDVYHRQKESVGTYSLYGQKGHLLVRLLHKEQIKGLKVEGDYPLEGYYDGTGKSVLDIPLKDVYITEKYLYHAMYLKRSSQGKNLGSMFNRTKYKIESGIPVDDTLPEVFSVRAPGLPDPRAKRGISYELLASLITPVKDFKRKFL